MTEIDAAPRWDMTTVFPSLDSPEFHEAKAKVENELTRLVELYDAENVRKPEGNVDPPADRIEWVLTETNAYLEDLRPVAVYVSVHVAVDSRNEVAQALQSELMKLHSTFSKLSSRLAAWLGGIRLEQVCKESDYLSQHRHFLEQTQIESRHQMAPGEEELYADLSPSAGSAWGRLHGNITSVIELEVPLEGGPKRVTMSQARNLAFSPDRNVRQAAYQAELEAWKKHETPIAAALNGIKGEVRVVSKRRGWESPLEETLFHASIDQTTLDAMMSAAKASFPSFRKYMNLKAKALGLPKLAWFDLGAPIGADKEWNYNEAKAFVIEHFSGYSPKMGSFAERAFNENWIDAEPRLGKRDGAFCTGLRKDESRVMMNFKPSYVSVSTLAHELGHAYHNLCLYGRTPLQRGTPMTMAETASIFCETIARRAALRNATPEQGLSILEASLQGALQVVVDISSRFLFESAVFDKRAQRELSAREFCELMVDAQKQTYGDGLDPDALHPYMWAMKPHYYSAGRSFYNFPYMFGLLFGLGLYSRYEAAPDEFKNSYDDLLSSTGMATAAELAERFGIDIRGQEFWQGSLAQIQKDVDQFEKLVG